MFQYDQNFSKKQSLLELCQDYNLPVSAADDIIVLENYLKVISDEYTPANGSADCIHEETKVYQGKVESAIIECFRKIFRLKLQS
jgi:hypothetical protein